MSNMSREISNQWDTPFEIHTPPSEDLPWAFHRAGADPRMVRIGTGPPFRQINHANSAYFRLFLGYFGVISATRPPLFTYPESTPAEGVWFSNGLANTSIWKSHILCTTFELNLQQRVYHFFFFYFLFYLGVHSSVITCSPMKPRAGMYRTVLTVRMGFHCSYVPSGT